MSKTSKRAISIFVIAILALSFVLPIVGVSADEIYLDAVLSASGSTATWAVDATYGDVVELDTVNAATGSDYAIVRIDVDSGLTLGTIVADLPTFMYNLVLADASRNWLALEMLFTDGGLGVAEISIFPYVSAVKWDNTQGIWQSATGHSGATLAMAYGVQADGSTSLDQTATSTSLTTVIANIVALPGADATWELTRVGVQLGWVPITDQTALIDFIEVEGVTYNLEVVTPGLGFSIDYVTPGDIKYDDTLTVIGSGVTSGSDIEIYWDTAVGTGAQLLNTTEGNPDGTFDVEIDVPSDVVGNHYLWVVDVASASTESHGPMTMVPRIKLSASSGLVGDDITVKGYGFAAEKDVTVTFNISSNPTVLGTVETDELGYFQLTFDIPVSGYADDHQIYAVDELNNWDDTVFKVGTSIILTPDEGPTGSVVTIEGRGWTDDYIMSFAIGTTTVIIVEDEDDTVASDGTFTIDVIIPNMGSVAEYTVTASEAGTSPQSDATDKFDITGIPEIVVSPTYGTPGATITVTGSNFTQIDGTLVNIDLWFTSKEADLVIAETDADGTFEDTFISPAVTFRTYDVVAEDEYFLDADDPFKVGLIALIINPTYGEAGTMVSITGIGFADGDYNVTFGTKLYEEYDDGIGTSGVDDEAISDVFWVPNFEPGTYDMTITDADENELTVQFALTESTYVIADPAVAPNDYNVTIEGYHFADFEGEVDFVIYNVTSDGEVDKEWDMSVRQDGDPGDPAATDTDGNFTAYWVVLDEDTMSLGDYTVNVTGSKDLIVQVPFSIVAARVEVAPRKALFARGDTIQFNINNDFKLPDSYIEIYDPSDTLYWSTKPFADLHWMLVGGLYTVPYYRQTDEVLNPMEIQSDAPMGDWLYIFYDGSDDQLMNGTFTVGASSAAQVEEKLSELWGSMEDLSTNIDSITDELAGDIASLSGEIGDVEANVQDMIDDITADLADELAGVAEDTEAAVDELEEAIGDIAAAQNDLASDLDDMSQDTAAAKEAAEDAQDSAQGLTTLVYGAIAASLIAALAAVVSLMQISKKIA